MSDITKSTKIDLIPNDAVNHPSHYNTGNIEVIEYIRDKLTPEQYVGYCMGNVLKYCSRWQHKDGLQDLEKAYVYLGWAIDKLKSEDLNVEDVKEAVDAMTDMVKQQMIEEAELDRIHEEGEMG